MADTSKFVDKPSEEWSRASDSWELTKTLRAGTPAMRAAGTVYLPQDQEEEEEAYRDRLSRSVLTNMYKKTADKLVGKPLKDEIKLNEDVPEEIEKMVEDDIDKMGTSLMVFAKGMLDNSVDDGVIHVLVDMPAQPADVEGEFVRTDEDGNVIERALSVRQEKALEFRPYARFVTADKLIGWKWEIQSGKKVLTQIRIREKRKEQDPRDEFNQVTVPRVRVIEPTKWRVFEKPEGNEEWIVVEQGVNTLKKIPLVSFYTNKVGFMVGQPLLTDIAHLNVQHWQVSSDHASMLHVAMVPVLFTAGFGDLEKNTRITIGARAYVKAPKGAEMKYVEVAGTGIEAGERQMKDLEERIQKLGMEMLVNRPAGNVTATARALDQAEADSPMQLLASELENSIGEIFDLFAEWMQLGEDSGGTVKVFKDFSISTDDVDEVKALIEMRRSGEISQVTLWKELKRRRLLSSDFDPTYEIDLLDVEGTRVANLQEDEVEETANAEGDRTETVDDHWHTLQGGGVTDTVEGHSHTWDEFGTKTSVDDGHSHGLIRRQTAGGKHAQQIPKDDDSGGNNFPSSDSGKASEGGEKS